MTLSILCLVGLAQLRPPVHRTWTIMAGEQPKVVHRGNGRVGFASRSQVGVLETKTGKPVWTMKSLQNENVKYACTADRIVVLKFGRNPAKLVSYDLASGEERQLAEGPFSMNLAAADATVYTVTSDYVLEGRDVKSGTLLWSKSLPKTEKEDDFVYISMSAGGGFVIVGQGEHGFHCFAARTGTTAWKAAAKYASTYDAKIIGEKALLMTDSGEMLYDLASGKPLWAKAVNQFEQVGLVRDTLIGETDDKYVGLDLRTGETKWAKSGAEEGTRIGDDDNRLLLDDGSSVLLPGPKIIAMSAEGTVTWAAPATFNIYPAHWSADGFVCTDYYGRIMGYGPGALAPVPTDEAAAKAFAERQVARFEELDNAEKEQLVEVARFVATPLVNKYADWAVSYAAKPENDSFYYYGLISDTATLLAKLCGASDTEALMAAMQRVGSGNFGYEQLARIAGEKGSHEELMPMFVEQLKSNWATADRDYRNWQALAAVAASDHAVAVDFMLACLADPKAPSVYRSEAFRHLAGTGGERGVAAVLAAMPTRRALPKWQDQVDVAHLDKREIVSEKNGWRLFSNEVLGNSSDLFISQKTAKGWTTPVFTGVFTKRTWDLTEPKAYKNIPMAKVLSTEWVRLFTKDPSLRTDGDKDGLTDLVELRLGTNAKLADSDKDGLGDAVDPCPNAVPRELGDREKIVAACVAARFFGESDWNVPATIKVESLKPFELYGYGSSRLFWSTTEYKGTLPRMYNTGVNTIFFHASMRERGSDFVVMAPDGKSATTIISRYSGGLNGDGYEVKLVKIGSDWFVTSMVMAYVS